MADIANSATLPPAAPPPLPAPVAPGHLTLPSPPPLEGPPGPPPPLPGEEDNPWRFGWRYVRRLLPDGSETYDQVPLSWDDLLYPEEEDFVVQKPPHKRDADYCEHVLRTVHRGVPGALVLGDCCIDFGAAGVKTLGPDVVVLFGVRQQMEPDEGTFSIIRHGGRPVLVIEVASPDTRGHDLANKPDLYFLAGVEKYVILDRGWRGTDPPRLLGYQRGTHGWLTLPPDARGRLDLAPVGVLLGLEGDRPCLYTARTGERLRNLEEAEDKIQEEAQARADAEARAKDAEAKARPTPRPGPRTPRPEPATRPRLAPTPRPRPRTPRPSQGRRPAHRRPAGTPPDPGGRNPQPASQ